jgi:phosphoglycerate dehydrogenase-like enzyme
LKVLVPDVPLRRELEPLPAGVELVSEPAPDVEVLMLGPELWHEDLQALLGELPGLRFLQAFSAGVDSLVPLVRPGVIVCKAVGVHDISVAEWVMAAILAMQHRLPEFWDLQRRARWDRSMVEPEPGARPIGDLEDKTVLVVGHGDIGRALAARLEPFGARVVGVARRARDGVRSIDDLPRLIPDADVVVDLLPLTPETEKFVDADFLAQMKPGALFVNAGRGRTVDTNALLTALLAGRIRAALDVTDPEPLPADHPLWGAPNLMISPHVAGTVTRWEERAFRFAGEQLRCFASGQPLLGVEAGNMPASRELAH